jgi:hypothetical protein
MAVFRILADDQVNFNCAAQMHEIEHSLGEIFDYDSSKPNFQKWSAEVFADTGGKSHGNVRAMHGSVAAGVLTDIDFNDHEKAIDITAHITDDQEWRKITSGTYSGFSIGGKYTKKWPDVIAGVGVNRYTADPAEISIVDRPCVPAAKFFTIHKADGSSRTVAFKNVGEASLAAVKAAHTRPKLWTGDSLPNLRKVTLPRESLDVDDGAPLADDGGEASRAGEQGTPNQPLVTFAAGRAYFNRVPGSTTAEGAGSVGASGDQEDASLSAIKAAWGRPLPYLPGTRRG